MADYNMKKMKQLEQIAALCYKIVELDTSGNIKISGLPVCQNSPSSCVSLFFPVPIYMLAPAVKNRLAKAILIADSLSIAKVGKGIRFSMGVENIWSKNNRSE